MINKLRICLVLLMLLNVSACVQLTDAVSDEPIQPDPGKRSFGEQWDDKQLCTIIQVNLKKADPYFDKLNVNVYCYNSVVLLAGEVPTEPLRELAGKVARDLHRVRLVYNELNIGPKRGFSSHSTDLWLKTKITSKLRGNKDIDSSRVEVYVEDASVFLMGMLSRTQTEKITDVVRTTDGVNKVVRAIEYID